MNNCLKHFSEMKYRDPKKKSNISTKFSNEFQFPIIISSFCGFDELVELKIHNWVFIVGLASHIDFCGLAGIRTFFYVKSVGILESRSRITARRDTAKWACLRRFSAYFFEILREAARTMIEH